MEQNKLHLQQQHLLYLNTMAVLFLLVTHWATMEQIVQDLLLIVLYVNYIPIIMHLLQLVSMVHRPVGVEYQAVVIVVQSMRRMLLSLLLHPLPFVLCLC